MFFVGREKESRKIIKLLKLGRNVILTGKFGVGRTALMRHIAAKTANRWLFFFVDFSKTPGNVIKQLSVLMSRGKTSKNRNVNCRYKSNRSLVVYNSLKDSRNTVLVLDNITKLTVQRQRLIRYFALEGQFQFVAIVERFLPSHDLFILRSMLAVEEPITLSNLSRKNTKELIRYIAETQALQLSEQDLNVLTSINRGYPLGAYEMMQKEHLKGRGNGCGY
ncbi:MAG: hypothetical protein JW902_16635 [Syntrophaceae bacterium]|nr:hypothetical protein [Syntrophaceae bacterium]